MGLEVELKLELPPSALREVPRLPWLRELSNSAAKREKLVTVYFDTAKSKLRDHGLALRVRHIGEKRLQTIKVVKNGARGAFARDEWEQEIASDTPDFRLAKGTALEPLVTKKRWRKLKPVFETIVERTTIPIHFTEADLELAVDRGQIKAGGRRDRISEVEIELKHGDRAEIAMIADRLARSVPAAYAARSKQERGYALSADQAAEPVRAGPIDLDAGMSTGDAFQTIGLSCLDHALANERAVREGDAEGIHQMRVGLRRLRAAMSLFKELLEGPETEAVKTEVKWLTEQLGPARDLHVLVEQRVRPLRGTAPVADEIGVLKRDLEAKRDAGLERAKTAVNSDCYRTLGLRTALWLANGEWSRTAEPLRAARRERPAVDFAAEILTNRSRKILKKIEKVEALDGRRRHKLRIAVKKLRYACEFFAGLFSGRKQAGRRKRFSKTLKALQGSLGTLNDIAVHQRLATRVARPQKTSRKEAKKALAMGYIAGQEQQSVASCIAAVEEAGARLSDLPKFW